MRVLARAAQATVSFCIAIMRASTSSEKKFIFYHSCIVYLYPSGYFDVHRAQCLFARVRTMQETLSFSIAIMRARVSSEKKFIFVTPVYCIHWVVSV